MSDLSAPGPADNGGLQPRNGPVRLRLFASAREAAGTAEAHFPGDTVGDVLRLAEGRFGRPFADVLARSRVWVNGTPADADTAVTAGDEVAVLPPVSGGAG